MCEEVEYIVRNSQSMDGESPLADTESLYPDTSSLTDLAFLSRSIHNMKVHSSHSDNLLSRQSSDQPGSSNSSASPIDSALVKSHSDRLKVFFVCKVTF